MKCIRLLKTARRGDIVRVPDLEAQVMVKSGYGEYVSKMKWKQSGRQYMVTDTMMKHIRLSKGE